ncbi:MAG TPA: hypothetical protein VGP01_00040 [Rhizomicrobium sp.]|jgi:hypothetical protein|nr:hypothetical protein [Rhizomicrobium sp.]
MAFSFDSLCALLLLAVTMASWRMARGLRAGVRVHLRFAAVLLAALAAALLVPAPGLGFTVALLTASLGAAALALALSFPRRAPPIWLSSVALAAALAVSLFAALAATPLPALACQAVAAAAILAAGLSRVAENPRWGLLVAAGAVALFFGGMTLMADGLDQAALFFAASLGLLTRASQKPVADSDARVELLVGGKRA